MLSAWGSWEVAGKEKPTGSAVISTEISFSVTEKQFRRELGDCTVLTPT